MAQFKKLNEKKMIVNLGMQLQYESLFKHKLFLIYWVKTKIKNTCQGIS